MLMLEVESPGRPQNKEWAQGLLKQLDGKAWVLIGMLADISDDCARFLRMFDGTHFDCISFCTEISRFKHHLKQEYEGQQMWRRQGTFSKAVARFLRQTLVLKLPTDFVVVKNPGAAAVSECVARIANLAGAIRRNLLAEFPSFAIQMLFACFLWRGQDGRGSGADACHPSGAEKRVANLKAICRHMRWSPEQEEACVAQYRYYFPRTQALAGTEGLGHRDAWAKFALTETSAPELRAVVRLLLGFLISETACERHFSAERRQYQQRPRMEDSTREDGLEIMLDGPPLAKLVIQGQPVGNFWHRVQDKYAELFGTKVLTVVKRRRDAGTRVGEEKLRRRQRRRRRTRS